MDDDAAATRPHRDDDAAATRPHRDEDDRDDAEQLTLDVGSMAMTEGATLTLGPHHPSMHGLMRLHLTVSGGIVTEADPEIGFVHRGAEKLFEVRDYRQLLTLANRHDWMAAFAGELGVAMAVERLLGLAPPPRAVWARTLLAELTRIFSHLSFLRTFPTTARRQPTIGVAQTQRLQALLEVYSGGRLHVAAARIGGLHADLEPDWLFDVGDLTASVRGLLDPLTDAALTDVVERGGRLDAQQARVHGASGPVLRATGVDVDLRRDDPYLAYGELFVPGGPGRVVTATGGDTRARLTCLLGQLAVSADLVDACRDRLLSMPPGPVGTRLPATLRVPEGETYVWTETPTGISGVLLVSRGGVTPWRMKLRSPSFAHLSLLPSILPGTRLDQVGEVLGSLCYVLGDADR